MNLNDDKYNNTIMQYFEWYYKNDGSLWKTLKKEASHLKKLGITALWLPPAYKGANGINDVGYGVYDLYDLGEFNQKGTIKTKYGSKEEYISAIEQCHKNNIMIYGDIVFNHRSGGDATELIEVVPVDENDRTKTIGDKKIIESFTIFNFPGRNGKYSCYTLNSKDFDGVDYDNLKKENGIFKFSGKEWEDVDKEKGNYDFLMGCDLDMDNEELCYELDKWGVWYVEQTGIDGVRLDAIKHIKFTFFNEWLYFVRKATGKELPAIGEYWSGDLNALINYLNVSNNIMSLFDVPLHYNFMIASRIGNQYDMRYLDNNTLVKYDGSKAITFVDNHDTEPGQALESWVEPWFKMLAYTFILTREQGEPCVFYGDYYGIPSKEISGFREQLDILLQVRKKYAYGVQHEYLDHRNLIGWTREGDKKHKNSALAALITNGYGGTKRMYVGKDFSETYFYDITGNINEHILIDNEGYGYFSVRDGSYSVWVLNEESMKQKKERLKLEKQRIREEKAKERARLREERARKKEEKQKALEKNN